MPALREPVLGGKYAWLRLRDPQPAKHRLANGRHDRVEVLAIELAVLENAVLVEPYLQHLDCTAIFKVHDHLRVAHEALIVGREAPGIGDELVADRMKLARARS